MKISKSLFKNLMKCSNFPALYDMYINRAASNVTFENASVSDQSHIKKSLEDLNDIFNNLNEEALDIFSYMFDCESGEDLISTTSAQLQAFKDVYTEVESLAIDFASKLFNHQIIASTETKKQKSFEYHDNNHIFNCFLDGYYEDNNELYIFEVKATTSKKFSQEKVSYDNNYFYLFNKDQSKINHLISLDNLDDELSKKINKKLSTILDPYHDIGKYIYDIGIERHIIENSLIENNHENLINNIHYYLIVLNSEYVFDGKYDNDKPIYDLDENGNSLFEIYDVNKLTELIQQDILEKRNKIEYHLNNLTFSSNCFSNNCQYGKPTVCKFFSVCSRKLPKYYSILEFREKRYAFKTPTIINKDSTYLSFYDLLNDGIYHIKQARPFIDKKNNILEYNCVVNNVVYYNENKIKKGLGFLNYPLYHLDFETYNSPLPRFKKEKPYTQSVFQYSLHIEKSPGICDLVNDHTEYLSLDHRDRREDLIKQLISDINLFDNGSVIVYNEKFEKSRLSELALVFPQYKEQLDIINNRIVDLEQLFLGTNSFYEKFCTKEELKKYNFKTTYAYYHRDLHGSFSIKKVLPLFTSLTYNDLDVKNGNEAILTYGMLPLLTEEEYKNKYLALKIYCRQDTWAMVEILKGLRNLINKTS